MDQRFALRCMLEEIALHHGGVDEVIAEGAASGLARALALGDGRRGKGRSLGGFMGEWVVECSDLGGPPKLRATNCSRFIAAYIPCGLGQRREHSLSELEF